MTDRHHENDRIDRTAAEIRAQKIDDATASRITDEVAERLGIGRQGSRPLNSCSDYQAEIPAFVAGSLSDARSLLVGDHTRQCVPCRRVLMEARGADAPVSPRRFVRKTSRWMGPALRVAAAAILLLGGFTTVRVIGNLMIDRNLHASVETVE